MGVTVGRPGTAADISQESKERVAWNMTPKKIKRYSRECKRDG